MQREQDHRRYRGADSGCKVASAYLGRQSLCFDCPFPECVKVNRAARWQARNDEIIRQYEAGETCRELASIYGLSLNRVEALVRRGNGLD